MHTNCDTKCLISYGISLLDQYIESETKDKNELVTQNKNSLKCIGV